MAGSTITIPRPTRASGGKPLRGVVVYDIELDGGVAAAAEFQRILQEHAESFMHYLAEKNERLFEVVNFTQVQAEVPLQERRGSTGPLDQIVFRGTRGTYESTRGVKAVVRKVNTKTDEVEIDCFGNIKTGMYRFPLSKLPPRTREGIISAWVLGDEKPREILIKVDTFEKFAKKM